MIRQHRSLFVWFGLLAISSFLGSGLSALQAQSADSSTTPSSSSQPPIIFLGNGSPPTMVDRYAMFFRYAVHVAQRSDADEQAGEDREAYRYHLQTASGLGVSDYNTVLQAALPYINAEQVTGNQIQAFLTDNQVATIPPCNLGSDKTTSFETYLQQVYSQAASTQNAASASAVVPYTVPVVGTENCAIVYPRTWSGYVRPCADSQICYLGPANIVEFYAGEGPNALISNVNYLAGYLDQGCFYVIRYIRITLVAQKVELM